MDTIAALLEFFLLPLLSGRGLLLFITEGTIQPPIITLRIITSLIEFGSRVTGKIGGLPMGGKGSGFQAIGNIGDK
jgi:hypothetical protein